MFEHIAPASGRTLFGRRRDELQLRSGRAGYEQVFNTLKLNVRFTVHEIEEAGDWAWVRTSSAGRTRVLAAGTEGDEGNNEHFVFRHENGAWKIHRYLFEVCPSNFVFRLAVPMPPWIAERHAR